MIKLFFGNGVTLNDIYKTIKAEIGTPKADLVI